MNKKTEINKLMVAFSFLTDVDKEKFLDFAIRDIKDNRDLIKDVYGMIGRAYHPMKEIEVWIEGRLTKNPSFPAKRVISECVIKLKLDRRMEATLWSLARVVKKRVTRRNERQAKNNV